MATTRNFELGLLPERKLNWRMVLSSYGVELIVVFLFINASLIWPERLQIERNYHVTELIPFPTLQPKPIEVKTPPVVHAKMLPPAPAPIERPRLLSLIHI